MTALEELRALAGSQDETLEDIFLQIVERGALHRDQISIGPVAA